MTVLNRRQWEAVEAVDRHVLVAAGAGTGKTHTVVHRILYLLGVEIDGRRHPTPLALRDIAAVTFTNAAAADLKRKLRDALRLAGRRAEAWEVDTARVGTIHSFCADVLREFSLRSGDGLLGSILDEHEGAARRAEAAREVLLGAVEAGDPAVDQLLGAWSVGDVEQFLTKLLSDRARLETYTAHPNEAAGDAGTLLRLASLAGERLEDSLRHRSEADYEALVAWTRDLLRDDPGVRAALRRRLKLLVVDEFQDTDPVQRDIAYLLGEPGRAGPPATRLMLVGDPKQSIYRFRRADVTVWRGVQRDFEERGHGLVVTLEENFRSVPPVLGFVDAVIGPALDRPVEGEALSVFEVPFAPVIAAPTGEAEGRPADRAVELICIPAGEDGEKPNAAAFRRQEAAAIARRMAELHRGGIALSEMAVLLASWSDMDIYESALRGAGLRTYASRGEGFHERREVMDLVLALETIRDPSDDRALLGFLRSPWIGLSDESLLRIARNGRTPYWEHLHAVTLPEAPEQARLQRARAMLATLGKLRDRVPMADLLEELLLRTGYLAYLEMRGDEGLQALANVRKFVSMTRRHDEAGVGEFLRVLSDFREAGVREGDARLYDAREDVVTITSIHAAKGLEWRVVAWCDLGRKPNDRPGNLLLARDQIALKSPDVAEGDQPEPWASVRAQLKAESLAEQKRLWYVAATRAKDRLILAGFSPEETESSPTPSAALARGLPPLAWRDDEAVPYRSHTGIEYRAIVRMASREAEVEQAAPPVEGASADIDVGPEPVVVPLGMRRHSATSLMGFQRCQRRHWFRYIAGLREPFTEARRSEGIDAIRRGLIVHDVLELAQEEAELDALLEDAIRLRDEDAPGMESQAGRAYREHLRREIDAIRSRDPYRAWAAAPGARRELEFTYLAADDWFIQGAIDLASPDGEGVRLLDVKTSQVDAAKAGDIAEAYAAQRSVYVMAAEAIGGRPATSFAFQFSAAKTAVEAPVAARTRDAGATLVRSLRAELASGSALRNAEPEECSHCGYHRVGWCIGSQAESGDHIADPPGAPPP